MAYSPESLFRNAEGKPLGFAMAQAPIRREVEHIISTHGGYLMYPDDASCRNRRILLVNPDRRKSQPIKRTEDLFSYQYTKECVAQGKLLPTLRDYIVGGSIISSEEYDPMDILLGNMTWPEAKERYGLKRDIAQAKVVSRNDELDMIQYIIKDEAFDQVGEDDFWKRMKADLFNDRDYSWTLMKKHFKSHMINSIQEMHEITPKEASKIRKGWTRSQREQESSDDETQLSGADVEDSGSSSQGQMLPRGRQYTFSPNKTNRVRANYIRDTSKAEKRAKIAAKRRERETDSEATDTSADMSIDETQSSEPDSLYESPEAEAESPYRNESLQSKPNSSINEPPSPSPRNGKQRTRKSYTERESMILNDYIINNGHIKVIKGNLLWKKLEEENVLPGRTWQSMKNHFLKSWNHDRSVDYDASTVSSLRPASLYTFDEDKAILRYILDNKLEKDVKGIFMWRKMEEAQILDRTAHSMKERYRKCLVKRLHQYSLSSEERERLQG